MMTNSHHKVNSLEKNAPGKGKYPPPFSLRLTFEERARLEIAANGVPLGAYIRSVLFDGDLEKVRRRNTNPVKDHQALAKVLAALGQARLSSNLNQLAKAAHMGALPVTEETESEIQSACADIQAMRQELIHALGLEGGSP